MKIFSSLIIFFTLCSIAFANPPGDKPPRLIVGIVVDQMRYDYITRYWNKFGEDGFKKLVNEGYNCKNTHYSYVPTYTGPGHASIYTGTTPSVHGIISNNWYNRDLAKLIYVTDDSTVTGVGTNGLAGKMSPSYLLTTTFGDELRIASNLRSKVIGIALKDRGAILPAGHSATGAYWFESSSGNWISSSWYLKTLPPWINEFNNKMLPQKMIQIPWNTLRPITEYTESTADDSPYEDLFFGETKPVFPHNLQGKEPGNYELIKYSPYGNTLTKDFALATLKGEQLGKDEFTDLLAISFSSPDYIGHQFGTHAIETEDNYLRLDLDLADLIKEIETYVGKENVLFFLTADHAAIPNVKFLNDQKIPAGIFNVAGTADSLQKYLSKKYGDKKWVLQFDNDQVYFDHKLLEENHIEMNDISDVTENFLLQFKGVSNVLSAKDLSTNEYINGIRSFVQKGFYRKRSGDVVMILEPGLIEYKTKGTTHGSAYTYDTHVPLLFYGWKIKSGETSALTDVIDIAPTISQILGIQAPSGSNSKVVDDIFEKK